MDWADLRRRYVSILSDMGFRPEVDSDGDVRFKYEGGNYYITANCDDGFFHLMYPGFFALNNKNEQLAALVAANSANRQIKAAKVLLTTDMSRATAVVECLIGEPADVRSFLMRALRLIQAVVKDFRENIGGLLDN